MLLARRFFTHLNIYLYFKCGEVVGERGFKDRGVIRTYRLCMSVGYSAQTTLVLAFHRFIYSCFYFDFIFLYASAIRSLAIIYVVHLGIS